MMTVGFTYDLRDDYLAQGFPPEEAAEFESPETLDAIENALRVNGYEVDRIGNIRDLVKALAIGERWDIVFNICKGVHGIGRESQVPCLLEAYGLPFVFSSSDVMTLTMNKGLAKIAVRERGLPTPRFLIVEREEDLASFDLPFPVFAKPIAGGAGQGITEKSLVPDARALYMVCMEALRTTKQSVLIESYLPGDDLTVGILGTGARARAIGVMKTIYKPGAEKGGQTLYNKENRKRVLAYEMVSGPLAQKAADSAVQSWRILGCTDGGRVDLRCDASGQPHFLEANPLAGLRPHYSDLPLLAEKAGMDYVMLIGSIMKEACGRHSLFSHPLRRVMGLEG